MTNKNLIIPRKTSMLYEIIVKNLVTGRYENITGWTFYFMVKEKMDDPDTGAVIDKEITSHVDPINGRTQIELTSIDMDLICKTYYYSLDYLDTDNNEKILITGKLTVRKRVRD